MARVEELWFNAAMARRSPRGARHPQPETRFEISAGGVIYRRTSADIAFGLISTKGGTRWQLPKGKQEKGETLEVTAAREVAEETGLFGTIRAPLDTIDIWFSANEDGRAVRRHKVVHFYLLEYGYGSTTDHDDEVDDASWFPADEALTRLTFPSERRIAQRALQILTADEDAKERPANV